MIKRLLNKINRTITENRLVMRKRYNNSSCIFNMEYNQAFSQLNDFAPMPESTAITKNEILQPKYDLTIIVPAYNAEKWINKCVDSIINQETSFSFVLKVINDGSKDKTGEILDSYLPDERMIVTHQENKGYSGARNTALKRIESKYVMFVDSDDYLLPNSIEALMSTALSKNADIVEGNGYTFNENGYLSKVKSIGDGKYLWGGPWLKVIKSSLFSEIEFPEGYLYEDTIVSYLIANLSKKTIFIDDDIYAYRIHSESITQKHTSDPNRVDSFWIMVLMASCMEELRIPFDYHNYLLTLGHIIMTYRRTILLTDKLKKYIFICTRNYLLLYYKDFLYTDNKYKELVNAIISFDYGKYSFICKYANDIMRFL